MFGSHSAQRSNDATAQVVGIVSVTVRIRRGQGHAQRTAARNDGHLAHRIRAGQKHAEQSVPSFMVRGSASFVLRNDDVARRPELDFLQRVHQVALEHRSLSTSRCEQGSLIHQIREVGARRAGCRRG